MKPNLEKIILISFIILLLFSVVVFVFSVSTAKSYESNHVQKVNNVKKELEKFSTEMSTEIKTPEKQKERFDEQKHIDFFKIYKNGIHDIYDSRGNKITGIEPNANKALIILQTLIENCPHRKTFYKKEMADIYLQGMHKFKPDRNKAKFLYNQILNETKNKDIYIDTAEKLKTIQEEEHWEGVYSWLNLKKPTNGSIVPGRTTNNNFNFTPTPTLAPVTTPTTRRPMTRRENDQNVIDRLLRGGDSQNIHNSQVNSTIKLSVENLKKVTDINRSQETSVSEIKQFINSYLEDGDKKKDALKSLDRIVNSKKPLMHTNMKEQEALNLVWNRIHNSIHNDKKDTLKENLVDELSEMQEFGHTVCSSGRFSRIIDTLNVVDPEVKIMDTNAINEEIMNSTAQLRNNLYKKYSESEQKQLDMGTHPNQNEFDKNFKQEIKNKANEDYVQKGLVTAKKMENMLDKWIDHI